MLVHGEGSIGCEIHDRGSPGHFTTNPSQTRGFKSPSQCGYVQLLKPTNPDQNHWDSLTPKVIVAQNPKPILCNCMACGRKSGFLPFGWTLSKCSRTSQWSKTSSRLSIIFRRTPPAAVSTHSIESVFTRPWGFMDIRKHPFSEGEMARFGSNDPRYNSWICPNSARSTSVPQTLRSQKLVTTRTQTEQPRTRKPVFFQVLAGWKYEMKLKPEIQKFADWPCCSWETGPATALCLHPRNGLWRSYDRDSRNSETTKKGAEGK